MKNIHENLIDLEKVTSFLYLNTISHSFYVYNNNNNFYYGNKIPIYTKYNKIITINN